MRLTPARIAADVGPGFHAAEATALQTAVRGVLGAVERAADRPVPVEVRLEGGRDAAVVVVCRNHVVGFVPAEHGAALRAQVDAAGRWTRLVAPGLLFRDGDLWRVWVGAEPDGGLPPVPAGLDVLTAPDPTVLGIPLRRHDG